MPIEICKVIAFIVLSCNCVINEADMFESSLLYQGAKFLYTKLELEAQND